MKKIRFLIFIACTFFALNSFCQIDTIGNVNVSYRYEKIGNGHHLVSETINEDGSMTITRSAAYPNKASVLTLANASAIMSDSTAVIYKNEIEKRQKLLDDLDNQLRSIVQKYKDEKDRLLGELKGLRTNRKIINESKTKLKNVK